MNIKYRLLCKRLIEERKRVGVIQYYNVLFIMELLSDKDIWFLGKRKIASTLTFLGGCFAATNI